MTTPLVSLLMGSDSDLPTVKEACTPLGKLGVPFEVRVLSAHRCPDDLVAYVKQAEERGVRIFIAAAGGAAHLAGVVAAHTTLPVVGVPPSGGALNGIDALYATVQMPSGIPVATVAVDGSANAGILVAEMLSITDPEIARKLAEFRAGGAI